MKTLLKALVFLFSLTFLNVNAQQETYSSQHPTLYTNCNKPMHGVGEAHQDCANDIIITSTAEEGVNGSIISGIIAIEQGYESQYSITITPGYTSVRIVADTEGETHHKKTHRTKIGNNSGDPGGRYATPQAYSKQNNTLTVYPNPTDNQLTLKSDFNITKTELYNTQHILVQEDYNTSTLSLQHLTQGFYILKVYLDNNTIITKHISKQ